MAGRVRTRRETSPKERVRQARQEAYRDLLLEAAERVFAERGYADAKMAEIALAAGVATGTVYAIFPGKQDLYRAIHAENLGELARRYLEIPRESRRVRDVILDRIEVSVRFLTARPDYLRIYLREAATWGFDPGALPPVAASFTEPGFYEQGIAEGSLLDLDPEVLQGLSLAANQVWLSHWLRDGGRQDPEALIASMQAHARRSLFAPQPADARGAPPAPPDGGR